MRFDDNEQNKPRPSEDDGQWTREPSKQDARFDFAAFLGPDSLEDKITDVLDGKDLLDADAYGDHSSNYVPRKSVPEGHGRHEIPGSDTDDEDEDDGPDNGDGDAPPEEEMDFREEAPQKPVLIDEPPPRPKVIVAEPAPRVYVDPQAEYGPVEAPPPKGSGRGVKWLLAALISLAVILAAVLLVTKFLPDIGSFFGRGTDEPKPTTDVLGQQERPTPTAALAVPQVRIYNVTAAAGPGGSVYPSGIVDVQEGGSVNFTFTPSEGYEISRVVIDGVDTVVQSAYTFSDMRRDHTLRVEFTQAAPPAVETTATPAPTDEPAPEQPMPDIDTGAPPVGGGEGEPEPPAIP